MLILIFTRVVYNVNIILIVFKFQTYTYFLVEGRTSAAAYGRPLPIAGRCFHVEPPIVKHSTELRSSFSFFPPITTIVFPVTTAQQPRLFSSMDGKTVNRCHFFQRMWQGYSLFTFIYLWIKFQNTV